jgi:hypothetical protein
VAFCFFVVFAFAAVCLLCCVFVSLVGVCLCESDHAHTRTHIYVYIRTHIHTPASLVYITEGNKTERKKTRKEMTTKPERKRRSDERAGEEIDTEKGSKRDTNTYGEGRMKAVKKKRHCRDDSRCIGSAHYIAPQTHTSHALEGEGKGKKGGVRCQQSHIILGEG